MRVVILFSQLLVCLLFCDDCTSVLKIFKLFLKRKGKQIAESVGIVLHCAGESDWDHSDSERVLSKCSEKYDKLVHLKVEDPMLFVHVANTGILGFAEAYLKNMWDISESEDDLTESLRRIFENDLSDLYYNRWNKFLEWLEFHAFELQNRKRVLLQVGVEHYNFGNQLFQLMLDPLMQYSSGYWTDAQDLATAQANKMELIARKLKLKPGMRVLDIGCGWGTLCKYLATNYHVECVGITSSIAGAAYANKICKGLSVKIRIQSYRDIKEKFDRIINIGMSEYEDYRNHHEYFKLIRNCLEDDGLFLCNLFIRIHQPISIRLDPFLYQYIFPYENLLNPCDILESTQSLFEIADWHNFGFDCAKTLQAWRKNISKGRLKIQEKYDEKIYRTWIYYLSISHALFASEQIQVTEVVFCIPGFNGDYNKAR